MELFISISLFLFLCGFFYLLLLFFVLDEKVSFCFKKIEGHQIKREVEKNHRGKYFWINKKDRDKYISYFEWFSLIRKFKKEGLIDNFYSVETDYQFGTFVEIREFYFIFKDEESKKIAKTYIFNLIKMNKTYSENQVLYFCN